MGSFYTNSRQPSPDEIMAVLSDKLDELSSLISAVDETGIELPDFEGILMQIRSTLETSDDTKQVLYFKIIGTTVRLRERTGRSKLIFNITFRFHGDILFYLYVLRLNWKIC